LLPNIELNTDIRGVLPSLGGTQLAVANRRLVRIFSLLRVSPQSLSVDQTAQLEATPKPIPAGKKHPNWWYFGLLAFLVGWLYLPIIIRLAVQWWNDPNFSHGFFVPAFTAFVVWNDRERIMALSPKPSWWGLPIIVLGLMMVVLGDLGAELFVSRTSILVVIAGLVTFLLGWNYLRAVSFPLAFLILMIPIPAIVFNQITFPLQLLASKTASSILPFFGVPVLREGNVIGLPAMQLEVAEACSGIRSLMSLTTLAIIYGYLAESRIWMRVVLALASLPIAVATNSLRIVGTGLLVQYWDPDKAEGFFHAFSGWLIFVMSLLLLFLFHSVARLAVPATPEAGK
jgi:exosortase